MTEANTLRRRIRFWLAAFIVGLALSGMTAIPLNWELGLLTRLIGHRFGSLSDWIWRVANGLRDTDAKYPFLAYGTDWLAFGHLMIAVAFIGSYLDPVRNRWVVTFGLIACICVLPWAFIFGPLRGIPFFWRLIDCSFGVIGLLPLLLVRRDIGRLSRLEA